MIKTGLIIAGAIIACAIGFFLGAIADVFNQMKENGDE